MIQAIRSIFGENVRTPDIRVMVDEQELTPNAVRLLVKVLRLRNQEIENIAQQRQMHILSLMRENYKLQQEISWIKVTVEVAPSDAQKVDIKRA